MKVLYFAWLKTKIGVGEEDVDPPADVRDIAGLVEWLKARGGGYAEAFAEVSVVKAAVNQEFAEPDQAIAAGDEIAFFPPVTGG